MCITAASESTGTWKRVGVKRIRINFIRDGALKRMRWSNKMKKEKKKKKKRNGFETAIALLHQCHEPFSFSAVWHPAFVIILYSSRFFLSSLLIFILSVSAKFSFVDLLFIFRSRFFFLLLSVLLLLPMPLLLLFLLSVSMHEKWTDITSFLLWQVFKSPEL